MPRNPGFRAPYGLDPIPAFQKTVQHFLRHDRLNAHVSRLTYDQLQHLSRRVVGAHDFHRVDKRAKINRPLRGSIISIKDNIHSHPLPTTCASHILQGFQSPSDAQVVALLKKAGAIIVSKTNMDEFGMGSHSTHSAAGPVRNGTGPTALSVGGSSGGSAMAVALKQCQIALGTDTGGSVRLPAAYLGLVGFKPSYGLLSRYGVVPYANSLDTVGIIARSCVDVFLTLQTISAPDEKDPTCLSPHSRQRIHTVRNVRSNATSPASPFRVVSVNAITSRSHFPNRRVRNYEDVKTSLSKRRIGFPVEYNIEELHPSVRSAWLRTLALLELLGHEIVPISLPSTKAALSAYYVLAPAEASSNLAKYDGVRYGPPLSSQVVNGAESPLFAEYRGARLGEEVKRRILLGAYSLSADAIDNYFIQAQKVRRLVQRDFDLAFRMKNPLHDNVSPPEDGVDYIVCPTAPTPPPRLATLADQAPLEAYINDVFTVPASLAGLPAISVPAPREPGEISMPDRTIGIQIIGQYGDDMSVIKFAETQLECRGSWDTLNRIKIEPRLI